MNNPIYLCQICSTYFSGAQLCSLTYYYNFRLLMKAPASLPGLDVRHGGERTTTAWTESTARAAATCPQWRGPPAEGDQRASGRLEGNPGRWRVGSTSSSF